MPQRIPDRANVVPVRHEHLSILPHMKFSSIRQWKPIVAYLPRQAIKMLLKPFDDRGMRHVKLWNRNVRMHWIRQHHFQHVPPGRVREAGQVYEARDIAETRAAFHDASDRTPWWLFKISDSIRLSNGR